MEKERGRQTDRQGGRERKKRTKGEIYDLKKLKDREGERAASRRNSTERGGEWVFRIVTWKI